MNLSANRGRRYTSMADNGDHWRRTYVRDSQQGNDNGSSHSLMFYLEFWFLAPLDKYRTMNNTTWHRNHQPDLCLLLIHRLLEIECAPFCVRCSSNQEYSTRSSRSIRWSSPYPWMFFWRSHRTSSKDKSNRSSRKISPSNIRRAPLEETRWCSATITTWVSYHSMVERQQCVVQSWSLFDAVVVHKSTPLCVYILEWVAMRSPSLYSPINQTETIYHELFSPFVHCCLSMQQCTLRTWRAIEKERKKRNFFSFAHTDKLHFQSC